MLPGLRFFAKIRLADEYYAAQDRAEVATRGGERSGLQHSPVPPTAADLGLRRDEIHNVYGLPGFIFYSR